MEYTITVKVKASEDLGQEEVARLIHRLIECGQEDATNAPDDYDDPDTEDVLSLEVESVS